MTSLVFETVGKYQIDSYLNVTLEGSYMYPYQDLWGNPEDDPYWKWVTFCRTPTLEEQIRDESFTPGNYIEMFDHKLNKVCLHNKAFY